MQASSTRVTREKGLSQDAFSFLTANAHKQRRPEPCCRAASWKGGLPRSSGAGPRKLGPAAALQAGQACAGGLGALGEAGQAARRTAPSLREAEQAAGKAAPRGIRGGGNGMTFSSPMQRGLKGGGDGMTISSPMQRGLRGGGYGTTISSPIQGGLRGGGDGTTFSLPIQGGLRGGGDGMALHRRTVERGPCTCRPRARRGTACERTASRKASRTASRRGSNQR
eukprot:1160915-Pelagomonas_calceolata.AAC.2